MTDVKISDLPAGSTIVGTEVAPAVQSSATKKFTYNQVKTFVNAGLATVATTGNYSDLSGKPTLATVATTGNYSDLSGKPTLATGANPTATAATTPVNGTAITFMRSDAAPSLPIGSSSVLGVLQVDGTTITATGGVITAVGGGGASPANPTATASDTAVNGTATTFMRSDAAPAVQKASSSVFGLVKVDGTTITATGGVISAAGGGGASPANPTATAGPTAINGTAGTFMRSDAAPAIQLGTAAQKGIVQVDGTTITATAGVISAAAPTGFLTVANNLSDVANAGTARTNLGLAIGTNVQAFSSNLTTWSGTTPATGITTFLATPSSANLASALTDKTGSGANVFATSPVLVTPQLGTPTSGTLTSCTGLPISSGVSGLGTGVATALAVNVGSAGAFVAFNGALGTPSSGTLSGTTVDGTNAVGFRQIPQNAQTGSYTAVLADDGKHLYHASGASAATYTIPANSSVAYPVGATLTFINRATAAVTIAITTDTLTWSPAGTTGSRTLAQYGVATATKITSTEWILTGTGLT